MSKSLKSVLPRAAWKLFPNYFAKFYPSYQFSLIIFVAFPASTKITDEGYQRLMGLMDRLDPVWPFLCVLALVPVFWWMGTVSLNTNIQEYALWVRMCDFLARPGLNAMTFLIGLFLPPLGICLGLKHNASPEMARQMFGLEWIVFEMFLVGFAQQVAVVLIDDKREGDRRLSAVEVRS